MTVHELTLAERLRAEREALGEERPPAYVREQLFAAWERGLAVPAPAKAGSWPRVLAWLGWTAGGLGTSFAALMAWALLTPLSVEAQALHASRLSSGFVMIATPERIALETSAWIVPGEVAGAELAHLGVPVDLSASEAQLPVEMLVSQDGAVLAVKLQAKPVSPLRAEGGA